MHKTRTSLVFKRLMLVLWVALVVLFKRKTTRPQKLRLFFEKSGGAFIKIGQILALRQDIIPQAYTLELLKLLGNVPASPFAEMQTVFIEEMGEPVGKFFAEFSDEPIASASIAQVYKAKLKSGETVAVKIQRPKTVENFEADFAVVNFLAALADFLRPNSLVSLREAAAEFIRWTREELDFRYESNNALAFFEYTKTSPLTVIPKQYPQYARAKVLIQEFIENGVSAEDVVRGNVGREHLLEKNIDPDAMALYLIRESGRQYFIDGFFHADPHPANLILLPGNKMAFLDFGIVGEGRKENRLLLLKFVHAISQKNIEDASSYLMEFGKNFFDREVDNFLQSDILKARKAEKVIEEIKKLILNDFKKEAELTIKPWLEMTAKEDVPLLQRSSSVMFFNLIRKGEKYGIRLPVDVLLFIRGLVIDDMVALQISPSFDMIKALNSFFEEFPIGEMEEKIKTETNGGKIGDKIHSVTDDWEKFMEESAAHKDKIKASRERVIETVLYYAEKYPEVYEALKELKKKKTI